MSTFVQQEINERNRWIYFSNYRWTAHVAYWSWVLAIGTLMRVKGHITFSILLNHFFLANLLIAGFFYLYCLYLIPYFFKRNKKLLFWVLLAFSFITLSAINVYFSRYAVHFVNEPVPGLKAEFWQEYPLSVYNYLANFLIFSMMLFFMEKNDENDLVLELEKEKKEIEMVKLDLLKTNISPDFMMRSMDQLKRAALVPEPYTPQSIITFSELLRYRLYRGKQLQTPLKEEINALNDFINFIKYDHLSNNLHVELSVAGNSEEKFIAPLALINIMEPFCKVIPESSTALKFELVILTDIVQVQILYSQIATEMLLKDLDKYGTDYIQLYGNAIHFNFENCIDETCRIEMIMPLLAQENQ